MTDKRQPHEIKKSGRKRGQRTKRSSILTDRAAAAIMQSGLSPLDVMMTNMRFWHRELGILEVGVRKQVPDGASVLQLERTPIIERYFEARKELQEVAENAAPYVHPRMSPINDRGGIEDLSRLTDAELADLERISRKISVTFGDPGGDTKARK